MTGTDTFTSTESLYLSTSNLLICFFRRSYMAFRPVFVACLQKLDWDSWTKYIKVIEPLLFYHILSKTWQHLGIFKLIVVSKDVVYAAFNVMKFSHLCHKSEGYKILDLPILQSDIFLVWLVKSSRYTSLLKLSYW